MLQHKIKYVKNRLPFRQFETQRLCSLHKGMTGGNCLIVQAERRAKRVSWQRSLSNHGCLTIPRTGDPSAEQGTLEFYHSSPAQCCASRSTLFYLSVFSSFLHQVFNVLCVTASSLSCSMCSFRKGVTRRLSTNSYADPLYQEKIWITYLIIPSVKSTRNCVRNYIKMVLLKVPVAKPFYLWRKLSRSPYATKTNENFHFQ